MSNDLKDILGNSNKDVDNQELMDYLSSQLNKANAHDVEKAMADDAFINDAVEGLQQMQDTQHMQAYVEQLNAGLQKQIAKNKKRKEKRRLKDSPQTYWTIIILLVLMVVCFIAVKKYLDARKVKPVTTSSVTAVNIGQPVTPADQQSF